MIHYSDTVCFPTVTACHRSPLTMPTPCRGDQHDASIVEYFLTENLLGHFHQILLQRTNRRGNVAMQVLQVSSAQELLRFADHSTRKKWPHHLPRPRTKMDTTKSLLFHPLLLINSSSKWVFLCPADSEHPDSEPTHAADGILPFLKQPHQRHCCPPVRFR